MGNSSYPVMDSVQPNHQDPGIYTNFNFKILSSDKTHQNCHPGTAFVVQGPRTSGGRRSSLPPGSPLLQGLVLSPVQCPTPEQYIVSYSYHRKV